MRRSAALILVVAAAVQCVPTSDSIVGIGTGGGTGTAPSAVGVFDNIFEPRDVTITRSGQIRWTWRGNGSIEHSVTFDDGSQSQNPKRTGTFTRRFTDAGIFTYYCTVHGRDVMSGKVSVTATPTP
ncbi:MAG: cupredoxin domain-containing protein [Gemmatimonadales bacterium]